MIQCGKCGINGHVARDCNYETDLGNNPRPAWCGECDPRTRLVDHGNHMTRCFTCWAWPAKGTRHNQLLAQYKRCGGCRAVIYEFDATPCGKHTPLRVPLGATS